MRWSDEKVSCWVSCGCFVWFSLLLPLKPIGMISIFCCTPKEGYTADLYLYAAYVNGTGGAVFVDVSVYWAEAGFVNFTTATVQDRDGHVLAQDGGLGQGSSRL
jgi:hypothetical protein